MVWYSHLLKNFSQFVVIHTVKGFGIVNKAEVGVFLDLFCFYDDPTDVWIQQFIYLAIKEHLGCFQLLTTVNKAAVNIHTDLDLIPGLGISSGKENGKPLQYSYLGNFMDKRSCRATVHGIPKESDMTQELKNNNKTFTCRFLCEHAFNSFR